MNIVFINHKGGIGKTTLAVNTAFRYQEKKRKLLMVDFDEQSNAMQLFTGYACDGKSYWQDDKNLVTISAGFFEGIQNWSGDVIFDCPPSYASGRFFIDFLVKNGIHIDLWIIPVESRSSMLGAGTIIGVIRSVYLNSRIVLVGNRVNSSDLTVNDRVEMARFPNVELYNQIIQRATETNKFEQIGGKPVWVFYKGQHWAIRMRDFADWVLSGAPSTGFTFVNDGNPPIDMDRSAFINTKSTSRREYGWL